MYAGFCLWWQVCNGLYTRTVKTGSRGIGFLLGKPSSTSYQHLQYTIRTRAQHNSCAGSQTQHAGGVPFLGAPLISSRLDAMHTSTQHTSSLCCGGGRATCYTPRQAAHGRHLVDHGARHTRPTPRSHTLSITRCQSINIDVATTGQPGAVGSPTPVTLRLAAVSLPHPDKVRLASLGVLGEKHVYYRHTMEVRTPIL